MNSYMSERIVIFYIAIVVQKLLNWFKNLGLNINHSETLK